MKIDLYIENFRKTYQLIRLFTEREDYKVYHFRHKNLGKDIVLRAFSGSVPAYEELAGIKSENLPLVYDSISIEDGQIVLEEFIEGLTVSEVMETGKYNKRGAKKVLKAVCHGLTVLHEKGIVHRDVKPENVMIDKNGRVVLIDFNASRKITKAEKDTVVMGTVGYASPEQLGVKQTDERTDIYAAGVLYNVMLTGKHPSEKLAGGKAGRIVRKCTNINPSERFQTAEKLSKAL
jgi:serine/threonine protein kinase